VGEKKGKGGDGLQSRSPPNFLRHEASPSGREGETKKKEEGGLFTPSYQEGEKGGRNLGPLCPRGLVKVRRGKETLFVSGTRKIRKKKKRGGGEKPVPLAEWGGKKNGEGVKREGKGRESEGERIFIQPIIYPYPWKGGKKKKGRDPAMSLCDW